MAKNLVIVESPAKARTIQKFLGRDFHVDASMGHVRDLPKSALGVDPEHDFAPKYVIPRDKSKIVKELKERAKESQAIYLATDPDREGEAIAWHLATAIGADSKPVRRIEFHEITKEAILRAVKSPRLIDMKRVEAQQARRILDRLVGYNLSPLLWKKVRRGLSAGRVQSVAVRLVVEREREIESFNPVEYWTVEAELAKKPGKGARGKRSIFKAALVQAMGKKPELANEEDAENVLADLKQASYQVADVRVKEQTRAPAPPFTTSTLQQEAGRKLGFTAKRTMAVAQQLYEGLDVGADGEVGLITYMRTDSTQIAETAIHEVRRFIGEKYGVENVPEAPRAYRAKSKLAQEAHEAIRPTSVFREPARIKQHLTTDQFKLYDLIWKRFVACQMASARYEVTTVDVAAQGVQTKGDYLFRANGSLVVFPGFLSLYREGRDDDGQDEDAQKPLPDLAQGEDLNLIKLLSDQHFTQPPPRYSEATLVKALEEKGIGRPSTYAPILSTIQERGYVERVEKRLQPTELGRLVNDLLVENFPDVIDVDFTANMEEKLDDVASGEREWVPVIRDFYGPFHEEIEKAGESIERVKIEPEPTDEVCEKCGRQMVIRMGRFGKFIGCSGFPECRNAKPLLKKIGVACPECGAELVERQTKKRRTFYGCSRYPECKWTSWQRPVPKPCPQCGGLMVEVGKGEPKCIRCGPAEASDGAGAEEEAASARRTKKTEAKPVRAGKRRTA
ncbi:MAG: type I DNA topoisomerase [Chloroflexota bacterium]